MNRTQTKRAAIAGIAALLVAAILLPSLADAHAFPSAEQPKVGSTINTSPSEVAIRFDNPIEELFATLAVTEKGSESVTVGPPTVSPDRRHLSVRLKPLVPGTYIVKWSVVAEDGHRTQGSYEFTVAAKP